MKARSVRIELGMTTALPLKDLKSKVWWEMGVRTPFDDDLEITQIQVTVIKPEK